MTVNGAPYSHNYGRTTQNGFGGINASLGADSGEALLLLNMTSDEYPILSTRTKRWLAGEYNGRIMGAASVNGIAVFVIEREGENGKEFWLERANEEYRLPNTDADRAQIVTVGSYALIFPFGWYYDLRASQATQMTGDEYRAALTESGTIPKTTEINGEAHTFTEGELVYITDEDPPSGTLNHVGGLYEYNAGSLVKIGDIVGSMESEVILDCTFKENSITLNYKTVSEATAYPNYFRAGDAVKIEGCSQKETNNKTAIIRSVDGNTLIFYDGTFALPDESTEYEETQISIKRDIPEIDVAFSHNNRVWAAKGRNIYCTKQGDPLVWSDYDSLADGSWWADSGNEELDGITGGYSYIYPRFFSGEHIYTVYGDVPADFSISAVQAKGVPKGENESFAVVGGTLFYLSRNGFMAYTGGYPQKIDTALGNHQFKNAIAAANENKYYVQCHEWDGIDVGDCRLFVYDTLRGTWHEETTPSEIEGFVYEDNLLAMYDNGIWTMGKEYRRPLAGGVAFEEDEVTGIAIFNDYTADSVAKKQVKEIIIRHEVGERLTAKVYIDGVLDPSFTKTLPAGGKHVTRISGIPKRCDRWQLRLEGEAPWRVWSIAYEYYEGSTK